MFFLYIFFLSRYFFFNFVVMNNRCKETYHYLSQKPEIGFVNCVCHKQEGLLSLFSIHSFKNTALEIFFANIRV